MSEPKQRLAKLLGQDYNFKEDDVFALVKENPDLCKETYRVDAAQWKEEPLRLHPLAAVCRFKPKLLTVQTIYDAYPDAIKAVGGDGWLPLHTACGNAASLEVIDFFLDKYPEAAEAVGNGWTAMHLACSCRAPLPVILSLASTNPDSIVKKTETGDHFPKCLARAHQAEEKVFVFLGYANTKVDTIKSPEALTKAVFSAKITMAGDHPRTSQKYRNALKCVTFLEPILAKRYGIRVPESRVALDRETERLDSATEVEEGPLDKEVYKELLIKLRKAFPTARELEQILEDVSMSRKKCKVWNILKKKELGLKQETLKKQLEKESTAKRTVGEDTPNESAEELAA